MNSFMMSKKIEDVNGYSKKIVITLAMGATALLVGCGQTNVDTNTINNPNLTSDSGSPDIESNIEDAGITTISDSDLSSIKPHANKITLSDYIVRGASGTVDDIQGIIGYGTESIANIEINEELSTYEDFLIDWEVNDDSDYKKCPNGFLDMAGWAKSFGIEGENYTDDEEGMIMMFGNMEAGKCVVFHNTGVGFYIDGEQKYYCDMNAGGMGIDGVGIMNDDCSDYISQIHSEDLKKIVQVAMIWYTDDSAVAPFGE